MGMGMGMGMGMEPKAEAEAEAEGEAESEPMGMKKRSANYDENVAKLVQDIILTYKLLSPTIGCYSTNLTTG